MNCNVHLTTTQGTKPLRLPRRDSMRSKKAASDVQEIGYLRIADYMNRAKPEACKGHMTAVSHMLLVLRLGRVAFL